MADLQNLLLRPVEINPVVDKASDTMYAFEVQDASGTPVDLRGYSAVMQLRPYPQAKRLYDELSTEEGRLEVKGNAVIINFPAEKTKDYKFESAFYDLVITSMDGRRYRIAEGEVRTTPWVTK